MLAGVFAKGAKRGWGTDLTAADVGFVFVAEENCEWVIQDNEFFGAGYSVEAVSPIFDERRRTAPLTAFSHSKVQALAGCAIGQHTKAILAEIGYTEERVLTSSSARWSEADPLTRRARRPSCRARRT